MSRSRSRLPYGLAALSAVALSACTGGSDDSDAFVIRSGSHAVDATAHTVVSGSWLVYFADEATSGATGTDLNTDGDMTDDVAIAATFSGTTTYPLRAAVDAAIVSGEVYLLVDEAEDGDWDGDVLTDNHVILHWNKDVDVVTFIDVVDAASLAAEPLVTAEGRVYYSSSTTPTGDETTLRYLDPADPLVPMIVSNALGGGPLAPLMMGEEDGLLFLALDETTAPGPPPTPGPDGTPVDYNADGDSLDIAVLGLLDVTDTAEVVVVVPVAMAGLDTPFDAWRDIEDDDWLVGVLVNEAAQGNTNLNDPVLPVMPDSCAGTPDIDMLDDVLHFGLYSDLALLVPPDNALLAGRDRVVCIEDHVATLTDEADVNCDMNEDTDQTDTMVRWLEAVTPVAPPRQPSQLHAVFDVPGGSHGLAGLDGTFVTVVDEAADNDDISTDGLLDDTIVGFIDPTGTPPVFWTFAHPDSNPGTGIGGEPYVGASWMAPETSEGRLPLAYMEEVPEVTLNVDLLCDFITKDVDAIDSLPIWADLEAGGTIMDFDGQGYALHEADPGITVAKGWVFYRVSESADNRDYDGDGFMTSVILVRNPQLTCDTTLMATASSLPGDTPVVTTDAEIGGVFLASEFQAQVDFNEDGDINDLVPRWFKF